MSAPGTLVFDKSAHLVSFYRCAALTKIASLSRHWPRCQFNIFFAVYYGKSSALVIRIARVRVISRWSASKDWRVSVKFLNATSRSKNTRQRSSATLAIAQRALRLVGFNQTAAQQQMQVESNHPADESPSHKKKKCLLLRCCRARIPKEQTVTGIITLVNRWTRLFWLMARHRRSPAAPIRMAGRP